MIPASIKGAPVASTTRAIWSTVSGLTALQSTKTGLRAAFDNAGAICSAKDSAASALKLSFAGINKGLVAVATAMILAATRNGADRALRTEIAEHWPTLHTPLKRQIPDMLPKAYRWVGEMQEIAEFAGDDPAAKDIFAGAARLFEHVARDVKGDGPEAAALARFFADEHAP